MAKHVFTGVFIPANIWLSKELSPAEKMILGEVDALSKETGWCYAGRKHFAEWLHCTPPNVTYYINNLERLGYLNVDRNPGERSRMKIINERFYLAGSKEGLPVDGSKPSLPGSKPSLRVGSKEDLPGSKEGLPASYIKDKYKKEIQNKDNAGNPLCPPFQKIAEIELPENFSLEATPSQPTSPGGGGPGAIRVSITGPEHPEITVHDIIEPQTEPVKTGRSKTKNPRTNEPQIHPENEQAFTHFNDPAKARAAWSEWIKYKYDQHRERYKSAASELIKLRSLFKETNGSSDSAATMIEHSIGNLYRGIYPPKSEKNGTQPANGLNKATAQHLELAKGTYERWQRAFSGDDQPMDYITGAK